MYKLPVPNAPTRSLFDFDSFTPNQLNVIYLLKEKGIYAMKLHHHSENLIE